MFTPSMRSSQTSEVDAEKAAAALETECSSKENVAAAPEQKQSNGEALAPAPEIIQGSEIRENEKGANDAQPPALAPPPDGGTKAWMTVLGGFCCLFCTFGWVNAIGVFQTYYQTVLLPDYDPSTIAWILSLETFFMFFGGIWVGLIFDNYGPTPLLAVGMVLHVLGLMMTSLSTEYYQLILAQGLCSPLGASCCFYSAMNSVVTWFDKRRGLALGIMASGSSLGGVIFPIMLQRLIPTIGFPWAMRSAAFLILGMLSIAIVTVKPHTPPKPRRFHPRAIIKPFRTLNFTILAGGCFCVFFALFIPFAFIPLGALNAGVDANLDQYVIPILNAVSIVGRITPGWLSDRVGRFNVTVAMCLLCSVFVLGLWLPAAVASSDKGVYFAGSKAAAIIAFAACYGFASGAFVSIVPALVAAVSPDLREIGTNVGVLFAVISLAALTGSPVGGALTTADHGGYVYVTVFTGIVLLLGTGVVALVRGRISKWVLSTKI